MLTLEQRMIPVWDTDMIWEESLTMVKGKDHMAKAPSFLPPYAQLLCQELTRRTGSAVELINPSKGGESSAWGAENLERLVTCHEFDLLIVAFGMNDGKRTPEEFAENIRRIVMGAWEKRREAGILLVATSTPNPLLTNQQAPFWGNHVNHPNDFFHRCYAQFLTGMLVE